MSDNSKLRAIPFMRGRAPVGADFAPVDHEIDDRASVTSAIREVVAGLLTASRGTVYRFGSLVVAFDAGGSFLAVGIKSPSGIDGLTFAARPRGARW